MKVRSSFLDQHVCSLLDCLNALCVLGRTVLGRYESLLSFSLYKKGSSPCVAVINMDTRITNTRLACKLNELRDSLYLIEKQKALADQAAASEKQVPIPGHASILTEAQPLISCLCVAHSLCFLLTQLSWIAEADDCNIGQGTSCEGTEVCEYASEG